ncbi:MAG: 3'-5' exonuclease [Candidatus Falkowbacteria bacterium]
MNFNQDQTDIINNLKGALLVSAPVGTGKTTVLTARAAKAIEEGTSPSQILCMTFTNRAAEEMRSRLKVWLDNPEIFNSLGVFTFHGFCAFFIKSEAKSLGLDADFTIADEEDQFEIMSSLLTPEDLANGQEKREVLGLFEQIYKHKLNSLLAELAKAPLPKAEQRLERLGEAYHRALQDRNSLDFNDLVIWTIKGLYQNEVLKEKWSKAYTLIQLDEFQDTHISEYLVVKQLAREHKNICLVGDFNQTIYGWRGSEPQKVAALFKEQFAPVTEYHLKTNYRSSTDLLAAFEQVSSGVSGELDSPAVIIKAAQDSGAEASNIIEEVKAIHAREPKATIAVLVRANFHVVKIAEQFKEHHIAHLTVDQYNFFRRQEIRDAFAYLKLIFNKYDLEAAKRVLMRPPKAPAEIAGQIARTDCGLRLADFLNFSNYRLEEPYEELITSMQKKRLVILDTETTGTNPAKDEIVQIYAIEIIAGVPKRKLQYFLKNTMPVGNSYYIHRLTDEFLAEKGQDPKQVLSELIEFMGEDLLVGHNLNFDLEVIRSNAERLGLKFKPAHYYDTLDIARRYLPSPNYRLSTLTKSYNLRQATHDAEDDVLGTLDLLKFMLPKLILGEGQRKALFTSFKKYFIKSASEFARWQLLAKAKRPSELLTVILNESGLYDFYTEDTIGAKRIASLNTLVKLFADLDEKSESSEAALRRLLSYSSLAKNIDFLGLEDGKVPIVTIHQVKGLEFDYCILPRLNEGQFPGFRQTDQEEEKRVFYVGITRARKGLFLSYSLLDDYGRPQAPSRYLSYFKEQS